MPQACLKSAVILVVLTAVVLAFAFAVNRPSVRSPETPSQPAEIPPADPPAPSATVIPAGFIQITIRTSATAVVEEWALSHAQVEVYLQTGQRGVSLIAKNARIVSVQREVLPQGDKQAASPGTVTLLVPEQDAQRLAESQDKGVLFFSLKG